MTRVLVVDDSAGFRAVLTALLQAGGYEVVGESPDGETALADVARLRPDLVLLDVQLPGIDGIAVAEQLAGGPDVVLVSTRDAGDYGEALRAAPALGFLSKAELTAARLTDLLRGAA